MQGLICSPQADGNNVTVQFNLFFLFEQLSMHLIKLLHECLETVYSHYLCFVHLYCIKTEFFPLGHRDEALTKVRTKKGCKKKKLDRLISRSTFSITHDHHKPDHRPPPCRDFPSGYDWINVHLFYISIGHRPPSLPILKGESGICSIDPSCFICVLQAFLLYQSLVLYMRCSYRKPQTNVAPPELHPLLLFHTLFSPLQCWSCWKWPLGWELCWTPWSRLCLRCVSYVSLHTYTHP